MSDLTERVARAIYEAGRESLRTRRHDTTGAWGDLSSSSRWTWMAAARAAIEVVARAIQAIEAAMRGLQRCDQKAVGRALMRLAGHAFAALTHHDEAASEHIRLGRQHSERGVRG